MTDLESYVSQLESELSAEQRRRQTEQLRALIEGARFLLHKSTGASERHVWYRCVCAAMLSQKCRLPGSWVASIVRLQA